MATEKYQCEERVYGARLETWQCQNRAVVQRNGKWFCRVHDQEYIAQKRRVQEEKWNRKWAEKRAMQEKRNILAEIGKGFDIALLRRNAQTIREFIETLKEAPNG